MDLSIKRGERIHMKWTLPFDEAPAGHVVLPTGGDDLTFYDPEGDLLNTYSRIADPSEYWLTYENGAWVIVFDTNDTHFLPDGVSRYEWVLLDAEGVPLQTDEGTVTVDG